MAAARYLASLSRENCIDAAFRTWDASSGALPGHMRRVSTSQPTTVTSLRAAAIAPNNSPALAEVEARPSARGKFMFVGDDKLYVRGVTYRTFRPDDDGHEYSAAAAVVRAGVRACRGHPAVLCYAMGNEIPAPIVRWHGGRRMVGVIERLYRAAKAEDPAGLVTYVNYPSSEYLQLPFLDLVCFNAYLESQKHFAAYLARLQNIAGDRPLIMSEIGLDSLRHGERTQAQVLERQIRTAFSSGCAGTFVYAWTDEWHRSGEDVDDWAFGLTRRDRRPKKALTAVREAFAEVPFSRDLPSPRISVVVCTYNGARVIRDCLEGLRNLDYPNFQDIMDI